MNALRGDMRNVVAHGRASSLPSKTPANLGSTKVSRKMVTPTAIVAMTPGVDHGADDHLAGLDLLRGVRGDAVEHLAERAGHLRRADHVDVERVEELGVPGEGVGELLAGLHVRLEAEDDLLEAGVLGLLGDALEGGERRPMPARTMTASCVVKSSTCFIDGLPEFS